MDFHTVSLDEAAEMLEDEKMFDPLEETEEEEDMSELITPEVQFKGNDWKMIVSFFGRARQ